MIIYRAWINQPSTLQPLHHLHGKYCIAVDKGKSYKTVTLYFTEGEIYSILAPRSSVSHCGHIYREDNK